MQTSSMIPPKGLWSVGLKDVWKGFIKSCGGLIVGLIIKLIQNRFNLPSYGEVEPLLEATAYFFMAYMGINYSTNNVGQIAKKDKPVVSVDKNKLMDLEMQAGKENPKTI